MNLDLLNLFIESVADGASLESVANIAQETATVNDQLNETILTGNNIWMMICIALVFIMHLGFAGVEAGFAQAKNTVNILFKNTLTPAIGLLTFALIGYNLMFPLEKGGVFQWSGFGVNFPTEESSSYTAYTFFLFQGMFAATCATIVSGAVAERIKISGYFIFTFLFLGLAYPVIGMWQWGGGFLSQMEVPFYDFAGSTIVHSVGGWGALAGIAVLGPRIGKYANGKVNDFPGSSVPLATLGVFLLWFGWFGFNGGSVLSADPATVSLVLVTTTLAAAAGAVGGAFMAGLMFKRLDLGMVLNGILAGLVGITAGADQMSMLDAVLIGLICGSLVVVSAVTLDKFKLDDCVGAVSVHLTCGIFGTLAVGIFGDMGFGGTAENAGFPQLLAQLKGIGICGVTAFAFSYAVFKAIDATIGLRVSAAHEKEGLDSHEHGIRGYTITYDE
ncbi:MAG: ammonium transporter [Bacteroidota bacterium]